MTATDIFERLIHLSDNGDESTGKFDISDNKEYKNRLLAITNVLLSEVYPYSDTCKRVAGKRPALDPLTDFDTEIDLDDYCFNTLVYGVAARMFTDENGNLASFYEQEYERRLAYLMSGAGMSSDAEAIEDVYSGAGYYDDDGVYHYFTGYFPYNDFGRWG